MADVTKSIKLVVDATTTGVSSAFSNLKSQVSEAEGSFGKLKAAGSGVFDTVKQAAPLALAGLGAAVGTFAVKAIGDFENLGIAAGEFSDAVGISTEDASRWIEVASDLGVQTDAVQAAMQRLNREAAAGKLSEFGIDAKNSNDRLVQTVQYLQSIPDETERARVQFELFGKSGAAIEPLIANAGELDSRLKNVAGNKIINPEEARNAKDLRDALDNVTDAIDNVELGLGKKLAPALKQAADAAVGSDGNGGLVGALGTIGDAAGDLNQALASPLQALSDKLPQGVHDAIAEIPVLNQAVSDNTTANKEAATAAEAHAKQQENLSGAMGPLAQHYQERIDAANGATKATQDNTVADEDAAKAAEELAKAIDKVYDSTSRNATAQLDAQSAVIQTNLDLQEYGKTMADGTLSTDEQTLATNKMATEMINTAVKVADAATAQTTFGTEQEKATAKIGIQIQNLEAVRATLDPNSPLYQTITGYINHLKEIQTGITTTVDANTTPAEQAVASFIRSVAEHPAYIDVYGRTSTQGQAKAPGGPVTAGESYIVGDAGRPELFVPDTNGTILPYVPPGGAGGTAGMTVNVIVNGGGPNVARDVIDELTWALRTGKVTV